MCLSSFLPALADGLLASFSKVGGLVEEDLVSTLDAQAHVDGLEELLQQCGEFFGARHAFELGSDSLELPEEDKHLRKVLVELLAVEADGGLVLGVTVDFFMRNSGKAGDDVEKFLVDGGGVRNGGLHGKLLWVFYE